VHFQVNFKAQTKNQYILVLSIEFDKMGDYRWASKIPASTLYPLYLSPRGLKIEQKKLLSKNLFLLSVMSSCSPCVPKLILFDKSKKNKMLIFFSKRQLKMVF
jgi:hypothetical protein